MSEVLPHAGSVLAALIAGFLSAWVVMWKTRKDQEISANTAEIADRATFRTHLMDEVATLRDRLVACEARCVQCHEEHHAANARIVALETRLLRVEGAV